MLLSFSFPSVPTWVQHEMVALFPTTYSRSEVGKRGATFDNTLPLVAHQQFTNGACCDPRCTDELRRRDGYRVGGLKPAQYVVMAATEILAIVKARLGCFSWKRPKRSRIPNILVLRPSTRLQRLRLVGNAPEAAEMNN